MEDVMNYFFIVTLALALSPSVKCYISLPHDVTVNTHYIVTIKG